MRNQGSALAWVIAFLALMGMGASLVWAYLEHDKVLELQARVQQSEMKTQQVQAQAQQVQTLAVQLEKKVADLEAVKKEQAPGAGADGAAVPAAGTEPGANGTPQAPEGEATEGQGQGGSPMGDFAKMFEGEQGEKMARMSANAAVNMQYQDLLTQLNLPPETAEKVRQILADNMTSQILDAMKMTNSTVDERKKFEEDGKKNLRDQLSQVLNQDELAQFDDYQEGMAERTLRKSFEMQLGMYTPGLNEENKQMVVDVMVEEFMGLQQQQGPMNVPSADTVSGVGGALDRCRERLSTVLDEDQMRQVDTFINQQKAGIEMFQQMVGGQKKPEEPKK